MSTPTTLDALIAALSGLAGGGTVWLTISKYGLFAWSHKTQIEDTVLAVEGEVTHFVGSLRHAGDSASDTPATAGPVVTTEELAELVSRLDAVEALTAPLAAKRDAAAHLAELAAQRDELAKQIAQVQSDIATTQAVATAPAGTS